MPTAEELMPLVPGRRWRYRLQLGNQFVAHVTQEVLMAAPGRSGTLARLRRQMDNDPPEVFSASVSSGEVRMAGQPVLRDPMEPGSSWPGMGPTGPARYQVVAVATTVSVPAGSFAGAVIVRVTDPEDEPLAESTYAPGVGLVRHRFAGPLGWGELQLEAWEGEQPGGHSPPVRER